MDTNHSEIVEAFRKSGWLVQSLAAIGRGVPDLLIARHGDMRLIEVKRPKGKLTADQVEFQQQGWPVTVVRTIDEAMQL